MRKIEEKYYDAQDIKFYVFSLAQNLFRVGDGLIWTNLSNTNGQVTWEICRERGPTSLVEHLAIILLTGKLQAFIISSLWITGYISPFDVKLLLFGRMGLVDTFWDWDF